MLKAHRFKHLVIVGALLSIVLSPPAGRAQLPPPPPTPRGCPVSGCDSGDTGRGNSGGSRSSAPSAPSAQNVAVDAAEGAFEKGDYSTALVYFQQASALAPKNKALRHAIAVTRGNIAAKQGDAAFDRGDYAAALAFYQQGYAYNPFAGLRDSVDQAKKQLQQQEESINRQQQTQQTLGRLSDTVNRVQGGSATTESPLEFKTGGSRAQTGQGGSTGFFGGASTPSDPQLDSSPDARSNVTVRNATDQLTSAANSGRAANNHGVSPEAGKGASNCAFDKAACAPPAPLVHIDKTVRQAPSATEALLAHIPGDARDRIKNDTKIQQSVAWYQTLDGYRRETEGKIAALQSQIDSGTGDAAGLKLKQGTLTNIANEYKQYQKDAEDQIKKTLKKDYAISWKDEP